MLHLYELARAIQADREREINQRLAHRGTTSAGRRHPGQVDRLPTDDPAPRARLQLLARSAQ